MTDQRPDPRSLRIADYTYDLPDERIARYPLTVRDAAKLLIYEHGHIQEDVFRHIPIRLPEGSTLVLNTAKVVRARMHFQKPTGGAIEIFCLEPHAQYADISTAMARKREVYWNCLVGGAAKWKDGTTLTLTTDTFILYADLQSRNNIDFTIRFHWSPEEHTWAEVMEAVGQVPLPPYLDREAETEDEQTYQTLFAEHEGSVAAPTASLHFTPGVIDSIAEMGVHTATVTLHVGAGTFRPFKGDIAGDHDMHGEWIEAKAETIEHLGSTNDPIIAGGTTALRSLESLYWMGLKVAANPALELKELALSQWEVYDAAPVLTRKEAFQSLANWMKERNMKKLITRTRIMIAPGYQFQVVNALITNFHQPGSTLLLLIAAFIGEDWKRVYNYALQHNFRFLSYGDASLLWREKI
jgi:S-adenosylmethionine:tRNA ribosyltransferase-isomerase